MSARMVALDPAAAWSGAALDSRKVEGGELFFAMAGEVTDGHRFVGDALERGASAAVVQEESGSSHGVPDDAPRLVVGDTYAALHALTRRVRRRLPERLVGVTGSAGKTTTKELLAEMLGRRYHVAKSPGNLNNLFGFPLSLLGIPEGTEWMVAEMGMSTPGELGRVSRLGRPDVAVFTNVRPVHLEAFGELSAIADAKAELLEGLDPEGLIVANADDPHVRGIVGRRQPHRGPVVWFGLGSRDDRPVDHRAEDLQMTPEGGTSFDWLIAGESAAGETEGMAVRLPLFGRHNVENFLAAAACAHALGVAPEAIVAAAEQARPAAMRGVFHRFAGGTVVIDESYNSNPDALQTALESAAALPAARRWAVLGEMLELGPDAPAFHSLAGGKAGELGFAPVFGVGDLAKSLAEATGAEARWFETAAEAAPAAAAELRQGDLVLVKGSRGVELEAVVEALVARAASLGEGAVH